ncbi:putative chromatin regulator PHD family [Rosa chinensis]|uniref:Putative chromatin regulator PHD family n=1 Tax=Rosa chinensis TaxID=74649 RepID=A0A2P6P485_ROSCH|nr:uncharacterized protein LOC112176085 isoform X1 [Rosa chinensis]PRQ16739.1 putative chromatin regulator PHD family [Rosa chinensis]
MKGRSHRLQSSDPPDDWVDESWTVDCLCGVTFDDGEEMVNCDECGVWVHTRCSRYVKGDDNFVCDKCKSRNSRNDSEETEVAQLLVELPTKTVRMESSFPPPPNMPTRRPLRLWTDIPMEERVHVQGIPGGDPAIFGGLSSVFTPELWKSTGYVPKKFNFQYREFPCWDKKEEADVRFDEDSENAVDKGAGVLFSLLNESVLASPVAALVGMRSREEGGYDKKVSLKETKRWDKEVRDIRCAQSGVKKERSLLRPMVLHTGKRKKDDLGTSKDRSAKKRARATEKEADAKKRGAQSSKSVFTPSSDAKQLEFSEDRGPKISKADVQSMKYKKSSNSVVREPAPNVSLATDCTVENHSSEALLSDRSKKIDDGLKEDKVEHQVSAVPGHMTITKMDGAAVASLLELNDARTDCLQEQGDSTEDENLNVKPPIENVSTAPEVEVQNHCPTSDGSVQRSPNKKTEDHEDNSQSPVNVQSSLHGEAKDLGKSSDQVSESLKLNGVIVNVPLSSDHKVQGADRTSEAVSDSHTERGDELSGDCQPKRESEDLVDSVTLQKCSSDVKHGLKLSEDLSKPGGILNSAAASGQLKTASAGKSCTVPSTSLTPKSSTPQNLKSGDVQNPNPFTKQQVMSESKASIKKDRASSADMDHDKDNMPRKIVKEQLRSPTSSALKTSHFSRNSHDSVSKRTTSESKDSLLHSSSKTLSEGDTVPSGSSEKVLHGQNKSSVSSALQRGEKLNQTTSSKTSQSHAPPSCPPAPSSSQAKLSDEELALLLHQELNSSPRVPRVPRARHASSLPQLASPTATSMLIKRTSSSSGKDHNSGSRRKVRDAYKDGVRSSRELDDETKRMDRVPSSPDPRRQDAASTVDATRREENASSTASHSYKKTIPSTSIPTANSGPSSSTEANDRNVSSVRSSPRNASDDDTGAVGPVHPTLPGLINEIMSKGRRMTYEELCNAVMPHWHNLRKHNGERYAYTSPSQAVLDCLRNRHEWARLVDRGPKTNPRKKRKLDADDSEDNEYGRVNNPKELEGKSIETQREDYPKGKRKARKRRRLALQGRGIKDVREKRKADLLTDDDVGPSFSNSTEETVSEDDTQGGGAGGPVGSEASSSSEEEGTS